MYARYMKIARRAFYVKVQYEIVAQRRGFGRHTENHHVLLDALFCSKFYFVQN